MRNTKTVLIILFFVICLVVGFRSLVYYPVHRRPPVMETVHDLPTVIKGISFKNNANTEKRAYVVFNDKHLAFPEGEDIAWTAWKSDLDFSFTNEPQWIKLFVEERWLFYKKRSSVTFFNAGDRIQLFNGFLAKQYVGTTLGKRGGYRIFYLGDSLTTGLFTDQAGSAFAEMVEKKVGGGGAPDRFGVVNVRTQDVVIKEMKLRLRPGTNIVVVELGTNDVGTTPVKEFGEKYRVLLREIRRTAPEARLVCLGTWRGYDSFGYDEAIQREADVSNGKFVYLADLFERSENHSRRGDQTPWGPADDFHPSNTGHAAIAERVVAAIME